MKKTILAIALITAAILAGDTFAPNTARCAFCYTGVCFNSSICGGGCFCMKRGLELKGYCYSSEYKRVK